MRSFHVLAPFAAGALALAGCTTNVSASGEGSAAEPTLTTAAATGIVVVEGSSANEGSRFEAVARFVRARAGVVDDDALRMAGAAVDFPASGVGSCATLPVSRGAAAARAIALLDVGGVSLIAGDAVSTLQARQLPDVANLVSGVVYSARTDELPSKSAYVLRVDGSPYLEVPPFMVRATSPGEPLDVRVGRDDGRAGAVAITGAVDVTWEPGSLDDAIYIDVSATSAAPTTRCLFDDSGRATLPASAFGAIEDGALAVHRLHREAFHARGIEPGEVRFDFARVVPFTRALPRN